jgi:hypothetical protein
MSDRLDFRHPPEKRRAALDAYRQHGSVRKAAAAVGLPKSTVHDFLRADTTPGSADVDPTRDTTEDMQAQATPLQTPQEGTQQSAALDQATAQEAQDELGAGLQPVQAPDSLLSHLDDPLYLRAFRRYVSGIANGTHPYYAVQTAQGVDPRFDVSDADNERVLAAVGSILRLSEGGMEALLFAAEPPGYIKRLYADYQMTPENVRNLTEILTRMKTEAYRTGINAQLAAMGRQPVAAVTHPETLQAIRQDADTTARQIAETWNRDAASAVGARWLEVAPGSRVRGEAVLTPAEREDAVREAMDDWKAGRVDWKAAMWADTEASASFNAAGRDFFTRNWGAAQTAHVEPYGAECSGCVELVGMGEVDAEIAMLVDLGLHPGCAHSWVWSTTAWNDADGPLWMAQADDAADEGVA